MNEKETPIPNNKKPADITFIVPNNCEKFEEAMDPFMDRIRLSAKEIPHSDSKRYTVSFKGECSSELIAVIAEHADEMTIQKVDKKSYRDRDINEGIVESATDNFSKLFKTVLLAAKEDILLAESYVKKYDKKKKNNPYKMAEIERNLVESIQLFSCDNNSSIDVGSAAAGIDFGDFASEAKSLCQKGIETLEKLKEIRNEKKIMDANESPIQSLPGMGM